MDAAPQPGRPTLYWDGDCGFCRRWIQRWEESTEEKVAYKTLQTAPGRVQEAAGGVPFERVVLENPDGTLLTGAEAVLASLATSVRVAAWLLFLYHLLPFFAALSEFSYRQIASHRPLAARISWLLWGNNTSAPTYHITGLLFPRLVGLVWLCAFVSLWTQAHGLYGSGGILPVEPHLAHIHSQLNGGQSSWSTYWQTPSLLWFSAGDLALHLWLAVGVLAAALLMTGLLPTASAFIAWLIYLSFVAACPVFLNFQWDALLLETGFLLLFYIPCTIWLGRDNSAPRRVGRLLVWWLLFRLMLMSGVVKLYGFDGDGTNAWLDGTALQFHYFTQPIPAWTSWWFAQMPTWLHQLSVLAVFIIELVFPFFIWGPRRLRFTAFAGFTTLMLVIIASGNYGFFNLLTLVLCLSLLDDSFWPRRFRTKRRQQESMTKSRWGAFALKTLALVFFILGGVQLLLVLRLLPMETARKLLGPVAPLRSINSYGLFSTMTTERPEITISTSIDGVNWTPVSFRYKPDADKSPLPLFLPHMPRLDWQMWFAALEMRASGQPPAWFVPLLLRLHSPTDSSRSLLENTPTGTRPQYFRLSMDLLSFTSPDEKRKDGRVWNSKPLPEFTVEGRFSAN